MTIKTVPFVAQIELNYSINGLFAQNVLHAVTPSEVMDSTALADLGTSVADYWFLVFAPLFCDVVTLKEVYVKSLDFDYPFDALIPAGHVGEDTVDAVPNNVAIRTKFNTGLIGRSYKGSVYQTGFSEAQISGNFINPTYTALVQTAWTGLNDAISPSLVVWLHCVVSRQVDKTVRDPGISTPVQNYQTDILVHTMGRRMNNGPA